MFHRFAKLLLALLLWIIPLQSFGVILTVQVHWGGNLSDYNIGPNSIIQIICYSKEYDPPGNSIDDNFNRSSDGTYYFLQSTPMGHEIVFEDALRENDRWFVLDLPYIVKNKYYTYVRIISEDEDNPDEYYWGITKPSKVNGTYNVHNFTFVNHDKFKEGTFDVIPEPSTYSLICIGLIAILYRKRH